MLFGDGDGGFFNPLVAAEVTGHEFMHAYSSTIVDWNLPDPETGAVSEAYSDIFSTIFEYNINPSTANYLIGDMVTVSGQPIRNMEDPNLLQDPDTYLGQYWSPTNFSANSNVLNYCYFLLTQGGSGTNDNGDEYTVSPISMTDAADILFRALSVYMIPNTDFMDTRIFGIQACVDLFGPCSEQEIQFTNAFYAIEVGTEYTGPPITEIQVTGDAIVSGELSFSSNAGTAVSWGWDFGDNTSSMEEMPDHVYQSMGTYEVILSATYPNGCVMVDTIFVTITDVTGLSILEKRDFSIYPNPTQDKLYVEYANAQNISQVRVFFRHEASQSILMIRYSF